MVKIKTWVCEECERVAFPARDGIWGHRCVADSDFYIGTRCESFLMPAEIEMTDLFLLDIKLKHAIDLAAAPD